MKRIVLIIALSLSLLAVGCRQKRVNTRHITDKVVVRNIPSVSKDSVEAGGSGSKVAPASDVAGTQGGSAGEAVATTTPEKPRTAEKPVKAEKRYHVIIASYPTRTEANQDVNRRKKEGYERTQVVDRNGRYRISIDNYATKEEAAEGLKEYKKKLGREDIWVPLD